MPYPTGSEVDGEVPVAGQFFDKGAAFYNVMHPDFGAVGDGTNDDGAALNTAIAAVGDDGGGVIVIPAGTYKLTTAVSFGSETDITLWVLPGVSFTSSSLPADSVANSNSTVDWSGGSFTIGSAGIDVNPGSDADADLITVGVSGTPRIWWDESADRFLFTNGISVTGNSFFHNDLSVVGELNVGSGALFGDETPSVGFFSNSSTQLTVTGSRGGNAALASLLTALATYGLIVDSTS